MDTYFTDDPPTCRARDRHAAEHRLPSAEVLGIGADEPQAQITATQGKSKLSSAKPSVSSRAYRIQVKPTGAAATTAMCEVLELVIGVWKGNGDETLDYVRPFMSLFFVTSVHSYCNEVPVNLITYKIHLLEQFLNF